MKITKKTFIAVFALLMASTVWAHVEINETTFPDPIFRGWVLNQWYGSDGVLTEAEIGKVRYVTIDRNDTQGLIQNLKGIEYFTALVSLYCIGQQLTELNVPKDRLIFLYCGENQLKTLDVSGCPLLGELSCEDNQLTTLNVTGCPELVELWCPNNLLDELDVTGCPNLIELGCYQNKIKGNAMNTLVESLPPVSIGRMHVLWYEGEQNEMTKSQVAAAKSKGWIPDYYDGSEVLEYLGSDPVDGDIAINETTFPDENFRNWVLSQSYGADGVLTNEEIAGVKRIMVTTNGVQNLKGIENFTSLTTLYCSAVQLTEIDVSECTKLTDLDCSWNQLTSLDVSQNIELMTLNCGGNQLTVLDVSKNTALDELHCYGNQLTTLDVLENTKLTYLNCHDNQLNALDLSNNIALERIWCSKNLLTSLDVSNHSKLESLKCTENRLTQFDVSGCPELEEVDCYSNRIKGEAMDCLIAGLPVIPNGWGHLAIMSTENEQNVMTKSQVAAAKAKGWNPLYKYGTFDYPGWLDYEGSDDPVAHQPLPFLEGNPIWVYKYEHMPRPRVPYSHCWVDTGDRSFTYYFLGKQKEIDGKLYTMMGEITSRGDDELYVNRWYPIREENGIVYTITDSLPEILELKYVEDYEIPYLQQGNECVLYNFSAEIGDKLDERNVVESFDTYQLMDGTECRVLKTGTHYDLYEKLGYRDDDGTYGLIDPFLGLLTSTNGHAYTKRLNAYYQDNTMLYRAPDAPEGLCVNDTIWTSLDDACIYASSYKADPRHEEVMAYIRQLQTAEDPVTFAAGQTATIILPTVPDASKGKYYRLDRCEKGQIVFEQELHPQARTPYIIVPSEDFSIASSTLDLAGLSSDTVAIEGISFIGSYVRMELPAPTGGEGNFYYDIIDTTPDCTPLHGDGQGERLFIGAMRAYLLVNWDDPIYYGGTRGKQEKPGIVLKDYETGVDGIQNSNFKNQNEEGSIIYDLSGRRVNNSKFKVQSSKPQRGIYIEKGRKVVK